MHQEEPLPETFRRIGICMSGGGYRAAAFHLGLLSYLYKAGLGPKIRMISTVSGGTFIGITYALALKDGRIDANGAGFSTYFAEVAGFLGSEHLVKRAFDNLEHASTRLRARSGREDFIIAMAQVYADTLLQREGTPRYLGEFLDGHLVQLEEAIFNATEFASANAFRFWTSTNPNRCTGNEDYSLCQEDVRGIRLADVLAASSCFPGGFEPMAFPSDFVWTAAHTPAYHRIMGNSMFNPSIALMDGGVYDNQGIYSLAIANEEAKKEGRPLDLFLISDTSCWEHPFYDLPEPAKPSLLGRIRLKTVDLIAKAVCLICVLNAGALAVQMLQGGLTTVEEVAFGLNIVLSLLVGLPLLGLRRFLINKVFSLIPQGGLDHWADIKNTTLREAYDLVYLRLTSVKAMVLQIFMARIRELGFAFLRNSPDYEDLRLSVLIDSLLKPALDQPSDIPPPSRQIRERAVATTQMGTTLWFTTQELKEGKLDALIEAGQATLCYKLLKRLNSSGEPAHRELRNHVKAHWDQFQSNPGWLREEWLSCQETLSAPVTPSPGETA